MSQGSGDWFATSSTPAPMAYLQWLDASGHVNAANFDVVTSEDWSGPATVTEHAVEAGADVADHVRVDMQKCELKVFSSNQPLGVANSGATPLGSTRNITSTRGALPLVVPASKATPTVGLVSLTFPTWDNPILARALVQGAAGAVGGAIGGATGSVIGAVGGGLLGALLLSAKEVDETLFASTGLAPPTGFGGLAPTADVDQWANVTDFVAAMHQLLKGLKEAAQAFTVVGTKQSCYPMVIDNLSFHRDAETGAGESITISLKEIRIVTTAVVPLPVPALPSGGGVPTVAKGAQSVTPVAIQSALRYLKGLFGIP